jgi:alkylated DNA nucleotide flippase Atl1
MTRSDRAAQIWAVLAWAARNRQVLTYGHIAKLIGCPTAALGAWLELIQSYCLVSGLPPLTVIVVQQKTGLPGSGFTGAAATDLAQAQMAVLDFDWLEHGNPGADALDAAAKARPSNG